MVHNTVNIRYTQIVQTNDTALKARFSLRGFISVWNPSTKLYRQVQSCKYEIKANQSPQHQVIDMAVSDMIQLLGAGRK